MGDLLHVTSPIQSPTDLGTTTPALFFTRWITYLASRLSYFSGTVFFLSMKSKEDISASRYFLFTRGLWLVVLDFTVVNFGIWFDVKFGFLIFEVIAAIGFGFHILGLLLHFLSRVLGMAGLFILVFGRSDAICAWCRCLVISQIAFYTLVAHRISIW